MLRIDSPGGSMFASEQILREIQALRKAGKPVVVSMSTYAASGGYYIAAAGLISLLALMPIWTVED